MEDEIKTKHKLSTVLDYKSHGKYLHAIQICEKIISEGTNNSDVYLELANLYELSGNIGSSFELIEAYIVSNPSDIDMKLFYGQLLLKNKLWLEAIEIFSSFVPEEKPIALYFLAYSYFMSKDYELARINYLSFLSFEVSSELTYETHFYLAKIEIETHNFEDALSYAKKSEVLYSSYWELHLIYSICYYNLGMDEHAIRSIEKAKRLNPKVNECKEWAGKIYLHAGDYLKSEQNFTKYIESAVMISSETYAKLGEACLNNNKMETALNYFELALSIDPANKDATTKKKYLSEKLKSTLSGNV